jgi:hypothetical protein
VLRRARGYLCRLCRSSILLCRHRVERNDSPTRSRETPVTTFAS